MVQQNYFQICSQQNFRSHSKIVLPVLKSKDSATFLAREGKRRKHAWVEQMQNARRIESVIQIFVDY